MFLPAIGGRVTFPEFGRRRRFHGVGEVTRGQLPFTNRRWNRNLFGLGMASLCQTKVDESELDSLAIIKEICWFDIPEIK